MTSLQIAVTLGGLGAIAWVNWYFFLAAQRPVAAAGAGAGPQSVRIVVEGGYSPSVVTVEAGRPVRLEFERRESSGCTEEVVLPDFGIRTFLPAHQVTPVRITPMRPGTYEFTCGMGMVRGRLVARERSRGDS